MKCLILGRKLTFQACFVLCNFCPGLVSPGFPQILHTASGPQNARESDKDIFHITGAVPSPCFGLPATWVDPVTSGNDAANTCAACSTMISDVLSFHPSASQVHWKLGTRAEAQWHGHKKRCCVPDAQHNRT
jgi:hypothetical protein